KKIFFLFFILLYSCTEEKSVTDVGGVIPQNDGQFPCLNSTSDCLNTLILGSDSEWTFDYYSSFPLDSIWNVTGAIIVIHGFNRNADEYFENMLSVVQSLDLEDRIIVIAPDFSTQDDNPDDQEILWTSNSWKVGSLSVYKTNKQQLSSFSVIDKIITDLNNEQNYPDLNTILVTGHSAGAQYTYLYSATNPVENTLNNKELLYAVANSSSYLYLNELREADSNYYIPSDCNNYNDWPFGLEDRNNYASNSSASEIIDQVIQRNVNYFNGLLDTASLAYGCEYTLQGANRLDTGQRYFDFLNYYFPNHSHSFNTVSGASHDNREMYLSTEFINLLVENFE
ncbi:MAG: hypothetical protein VX960_03440, partial [Candidatus Neomarinimicrobiota bacterium]|nr:hypothetical protein [Candidatus Neomarinimicrobiota bacterium]